MDAGDDAILEPAPGEAPLWRRVRISALFDAAIDETVVPHFLHRVFTQPQPVVAEQGMTSDPTRALKAAIVQRPFQMRFSGATDFNYAADVAHVHVG